MVTADPVNVQASVADVPCQFVKVQLVFCAQTCMLLPLSPIVPATSMIAVPMYVSELLMSRFASMKIEPPIARYFDGTVMLWKVFCVPSSTVIGEAPLFQIR